MSSSPNSSPRRGGPSRSKQSRPSNSSSASSRTALSAIFTGVKRPAHRSKAKCRARARLSRAFSEPARSEEHDYCDHSPVISSDQDKTHPTITMDVTMEEQTSQLQYTQATTLPISITELMRQFAATKAELNVAEEALIEMEESVRARSRQYRTAIERVEKRLDFDLQCYGNDARCYQWCVRRADLERALDIMTQQVLDHRRKVCKLRSHQQKIGEALVSALEVLSATPNQYSIPHRTPYETPFDEALIYTTERELEAQEKKDDEEWRTLLNLPFQDVKHPMIRDRLAEICLGKLEEELKYRPIYEESLRKVLDQQRRVANGEPGFKGHEEAGIKATVTTFKELCDKTENEIASLVRKGNELGLKISPQGEVLHNPYIGESRRRIGRSWYYTTTPASEGQDLPMSSQEADKILDKSKEEVSGWQKRLTVSDWEACPNIAPETDVDTWRIGEESLVLENFPFKSPIKTFHKVGPREEPSSYDNRSNGTADDDLQLGYTFWRKRVDAWRAHGEYMQQALPEALRR